MQNVMLRWWDDDAGAVIAAEWILVSTLLTLGAVTGLVAIRQAVIAEFHDLANALVTLNQSYSVSGQSNGESTTAGEQFVEGLDRIVVHSVAAIPGGIDTHAVD
jgi:Flp pilus assembly pilin Flp